MYGLLFRLVFSRTDPERAHHLAFRLIRIASRVPVLRSVLRAALVTPAAGSVRVLGRTFPSPFGLAAGFDKNARGVPGLTMLGFGFVEIGTVTAWPQPGNERPRLWRIIEDRALRNRMGFNNDGAVAVAKRLRRLRSTPAGRALVVGVNIGKTKATPPEDAADDYATSAGHLAPYADYLVVNVSSPNTPGLRDLQSVDALRPILQAVRIAADESAAVVQRPRVPLLVKIAPDLADGDVDAVADLVLELGLDGVVAVNTTIAHDLGEGGLSGPPLLERGLLVVARLRHRLGAGPVVMGVGGISTPADARAYLAAGADLVQGYTGFVYRGAVLGIPDLEGTRPRRCRPRRPDVRVTTLRPQWAWELSAGSGRVLDHPLSPAFTTRFDAEEWLGLHWRTLRDQGAHIALLHHDGASVPPAHTLASIPDAVTYPAHS